MKALLLAILKFMLGAVVMVFLLISLGVTVFGGFLVLTGELGWWFLPVVGLFATGLFGVLLSEIMFS